MHPHCHMGYSGSNNLPWQGQRRTKTSGSGISEPSTRWGTIVSVFPFGVVYQGSTLFFLSFPSYLSLIYGLRLWKISIT